MKPYSRWISETHILYQAKTSNLGDVDKVLNIVGKHALDLTPQVESLARDIILLDSATSKDLLVHGACRLLRETRETLNDFKERPCGNRWRCIVTTNIDSDPNSDDFIPVFTEFLQTLTVPQRAQLLEKLQAVKQGPSSVMLDVIVEFIATLDIAFHL